MLPDGGSADNTDDHFNGRSGAGDSVRLENALVAVAVWRVLDDRERLQFATAF